MFSLLLVVDFILLFAFIYAFCGGNLVASFESSDHGGQNRVNVGRGTRARIGMTRFSYVSSVSDGLPQIYWNFRSCRTAIAYFLFLLSHIGIIYARICGQCY